MAAITPPGGTLKVEAIFSEANDVLAYVAAFATGLVGLGFVRLAVGMRGLVGHMALGLLVMHLAVLTRTLYWDAASDIVGEEKWSRWFEMSGGANVNIVFNTLIVFASYHALRALQLSIPEDIRDRYTLLGAAFYPRLGLIDALASAMRQTWRWLFGRA